MTQTLAILTRHGSLQREIPAPDQTLVPGVRWGRAETFPSPAYWLQLALTQRLEQPVTLRSSGRTLTEEVGAWLLAGQGVTAQVAQAAYERLRARGVFAFARDGRPSATPSTAPQADASEADFAAWLAQPLDVGGRLVPYRLAAQKAKYLAATLPALRDGPGATDGRALRDWLMSLPGLGPKTATGIVRAWAGADDVALLDSALLKVGQVMGVFPRALSIERHYLELEARFLRLCQAMDLRPVELETVIAQELQRSPETARGLADQLKAAEPRTVRPRRAQAPEQLSLVFAA